MLPASGLSAIFKRNSMNACRRKPSRWFVEEEEQGEGEGEEGKEGEEEEEEGGAGGGR